MKINENKIKEFLEGRTSPEQTIDILAAIAADPALEEYVVTEKRLNYSAEQLQDYGSFIPASNMAADDGRNLCDFQCETFILGKENIIVSEEDLAAESRQNYWLRDQGTPLFNMGKLMERNGLLVNRLYDLNLDNLKMLLADQNVIVVVNGDTLQGKDNDIFSSDFSLDDNPNHAVVVLEISDSSVKLFNPAVGEEPTDYPLDVFVDAWNQSRCYTVCARRKKTPYEYNPQPIDVSSVSLNPELEELTDMIAENAHDVWAFGKYSSCTDKDNIYAPLDENGQEQKGHNHYYVPFYMLSEKDKQPDREMATNTIKLVKRLGYRLVNINSQHRCMECGSLIEEDDNFCRHCGRQLSWKDFSDNR